MSAAPLDRANLQDALVGDEERPIVGKTMLALDAAPPLVRPVAVDQAEELRHRLQQPDAFLSRTDLRDLGLPRRAVDACFRGCPVIVLPGFSRPLIRVADYKALIAEHTYHDDRVRPT